MNLATDTPRAVSSSLDEGSAMSAQPTQKPVCAVVGVGPGNGAALGRRFAAEGYAVALLARTTSLTSRLAHELPLARAYACDAGDPGKTLTLLYSDTLGQTGADLSEEDDEHDLVEKWTPRFRCQSKSMALSIFTKGRIRGLRVQPAHPKPETARLRPA
jgi:NAD(P)-dependent dehydrogenase (short-subunit alcohol dehydrogenase family)